MKTDDIVKAILNQNFEESVHEEVADMIPEYLDDDWSNEFESEYDAYQEQGRGEAESAVLQEIITAYCEDNTVVLIGDQYCDIFDALKSEWCL